EVVAAGEIVARIHGEQALGKTPRLVNAVVGPGVTQRRVPGVAQDPDLAEQRGDPARRVPAPAVFVVVAAAQVAIRHAPARRGATPSSYRRRHPAWQVRSPAPAYLSVASRVWLKTPILPTSVPLRRGVPRRQPSPRSYRAPRQ